MDISLVNKLKNQMFDIQCVINWIEENANSFEDKEGDMGCIYDIQQKLYEAIDIAEKNIDKDYL